MLPDKTDSYSVVLDQEIRLIEDDKFGNALKHNASDYYTGLIDDIDSGVINVFGPPGLGKTLIAHKIAFEYYKKGKGLAVNFDFTTAYRYISKDMIILVKQGAVEISGKDEADGYGTEQYQSYTSKRNGIAILISTKRLMDPSIDFSIEALGHFVDGEIRYTKGLLYKKSMIGFLEFGSVEDEDFLERIQYLTDQAREEYHKSELERIYEDLEYSTEELIRFITIPEKIIFAKTELRKTENAILPLKILIYGGIFSGKSTLLEIIHHLLNEKYGPEHVHSNMHEYDLGILMKKGFSDDRKKYIQVIAVEDATYALPANSDISHDWINLRHTLNERTGGRRSDRSLGVQQAYIIAALLLHRLTGKACPIEYRQSFDLQFFLDIPTNKWDRDYIMALLEASIYWTFLKKVVADRTRAKQTGDVEKYLELLGTGVCITKEGMFAFRLNLDTYQAEPIELMEKTASWRGDWKILAQALAQRYKNYSKPPQNFILDNEITMYEIEKYDRIRPTSEGGINYRTRTINYAKALMTTNFEYSSSHTHTLTMPKYDISNTKYPQDKKVIMSIQLDKFGQRYKLDYMPDYLKYTNGASFEKIGVERTKRNNKKTGKNSAHGGIKLLKTKLTEASDTGGIGFLWEQTIWIYTFLLIEKQFGKAIIKIYSENGELRKESEELIERDYRDHDKEQWTISPPQKIKVVKLAPIHPLMIAHPATKTLDGYIVNWIGGKGKDDFRIDYYLGDVLSDRISIECKSSASRTRKDNDTDYCQCRVRKVHDSFKRTGGFIFHFHPWKFISKYSKPDKVPPMLKKGSVGIRGVLEELLLIPQKKKKSNK